MSQLLVIARRIASRALGLGVAIALPAAIGCAKVPDMRGQIEGLKQVTEQAEANGAAKCAPRQLATAQSHLLFASVELDQGSWVRAQDHLMIAAPNARAAFDQSPPEKCTTSLPGDRDGDGYPDPQDACPDAPENFQGFEDEDGCPDDPDIDGDGIPDSRDACVLTPEDIDSYLDSDGCPDLDNDADTVPDAQDKRENGESCALEPEDPDGFEDSDGCPDPDNDQDQVVDKDDFCPNEPGPDEGERPGCPQKPSLVVVTDKEIKITQQIHFEFDKAVIRPQSYPILDAVVEVLEKNPKIRLEIQGHTDNRGSPAYNKQLSDRRAGSVREYLVSKGIDPGRLTSQGYGMEKPIVPNNTPENRALNRRVQFVRTDN